MTNKHFSVPRILLMGDVEYSTCFNRMMDFTLTRGPQTRDEFWLLQHPPIYTQGSSCNARPKASNENIPIIKTDRGGQITYHGPGQIIVYLLIDMKRLGVGPKRLVRKIEQGILVTLKQYGVEAKTQLGAPGVYVNKKKIAALGLRIKRGMSYHGMSLNVSMDLSPFEAIDPCGYKDLEVTQLSSLGVKTNLERVRHDLVDGLIEEIYS